MNLALNIAMNGDNRATLGTFLQCIISLLAKWWSLSQIIMCLLCLTHYIVNENKEQFNACFFAETVYLGTFNMSESQDGHLLMWADALYFTPGLECISASLAWESLNMSGLHRTVWEIWGLFLHRDMGSLLSPVKTILTTESWKGLWEAFEEKLNRRCVLLCSGSLLCWDGCCPWEN